MLRGVSARKRLRAKRRKKEKLCAALRRRMALASSPKVNVFLRGSTSSGHNPLAVTSFHAPALGLRARWPHPAARCASSFTIGKSSPRLPITVPTIDETWLATPLSSDPLRELTPLRRHLKAVRTSGDARSRQIDACRPRIEAADNAVLGLLASASLPLPESMRQIALALDEVHGLCVEALDREDHSDALGRLYHLQRRYLLALMSFRAPPPDLLPRAVAAYRLAGNRREAGILFGALLAMVVVRIEGFAPWEIALIVSAAEHCAECIDIRPTLPEYPDTWYWLTRTGHQRPIAWSRQPPAARADLLYFDCSEMADAIGRLAQQLSSGTPARLLGLPPAANLPACVETLQRAAARWRAPLERQFQRQDLISGMQICCRIGELWRSLRGEHGAEIEVSHWMTLNTGPQGYAIMHLQGNVSGLVAGSALGIRGSSEAVWAVCLVRWARSDNPAHIELGLELIAPAAKAVHIAPQDGETLAALFLPSHPGLEFSEALLASREQMPLGEFTLIEEEQGRIKLTSCKAGLLLHQTNTTVVREFKRLALPQ